MLQDLLQKLCVLAIEDGSLGTVVDVQKLEQYAEDDGDKGYNIHFVDELSAWPLLTALDFL